MSRTELLQVGLLLATALSVVAAACTVPQDQRVATNEGGPASTAAASTTAGDPAHPDLTPGPGVVSSLATTSGDGSGNRLVTGQASLLQDPIVVPLQNAGEWIVGAATEGGVLWVVADADGRLAGYLQAGGVVEVQELDVSALPPGMPPTLLIRDGDVRVFDPLRAAADLPDDRPLAPLAGHLESAGVPVLVLADGGLLVSGVPVPGVDALPDTRIVVSDRGVLALMTDPTQELAHAVLGDATEASTVTIVDPGVREVVGVLTAPDRAVFEALSPMWADIDGDGNQEILVTASTVDDGARVMVYDTNGTVRGESAAIGIGNRWLNLLGVGPVGPTGEIEVVEVKTPHIGGIVQWYRLEEGVLSRQAAASGYSTHGIFSRNLDEGLIVDADGDGHLDVLVPTQDDRRLVALRRVDDGAEVVASIDLGAEVSSNVAAVAREDGSVSLAVSTVDGRLLIWP